MLEALLARMEPQALRALEAALAAAGELGHQFVGTEHVLLGALAALDGPASELLGVLGCHPSALRDEVLGRATRGHSTTPGPHLPFTPKALSALSAAHDSAAGLGAQSIGVEHLLLGLIAEPATIAGRCFASRGVRLEAARAALVGLGDGRR